MSIVGGQQPLEKSVNNIAKQDTKAFSYISTDVPGHLKINPSQKEILNVRFKNSKPVKRSVVGDLAKFHTQKIENDTKKNLSTNLA